MATKKKAPPVEKDDDEERPAKKKKKKKVKESSAALLYVLIGTVVALLVVAGGGTAAYFIFKRPANPPVAQAPQEPGKGSAEEKDDRSPQRIISPSIKEGNPAKKGGVANNVRGAVYRSERRNELANINKMHSAWQLDAGPKTLDGYLEYIKRDFRPGYEAIKEGYYRVNVKAKGGEILAGERDTDTNGQHLAVRVNGSVDYVTVDEWKKAMGIP